MHVAGNSLVPLPVEQDTTGFHLQPTLFARIPLLPDLMLRHALGISTVSLSNILLAVVTSGEILSTDLN